MATDVVRVGRALISVSDKSGLADLASALAPLGVELLSTGGTAAALSAAGFTVLDVAQITGFPEMMDGRVKTLHPRVHGGLLAIRSEPAHQAAMIANDIAPIDLLVVNLYPFEATLRSGAPYEERIELIDIGGPAMIRSAAKNHDDVAVIVDVADYAALIEELQRNEGATSLAFRRKMAQKAFARTAAYDAAISNWLAVEIHETTPKWRAFGGVLHPSFGSLRYGENPHQSAAFYLTAETRPGVATARQIQGKELSFNNINDTDAAYELVAEFDPAESAAAAIIKHANPCGVALGETLLEAYEKAFACDPVSAFGGVVALNRRLDAVSARKIVEIFTEVIIAPEADDEALAIIAREKEPPASHRRRAPRPAPADAWRAIGCGRAPGPGSRQRRARRRGAQDRDQARAELNRNGGLEVRLARRQTCEVERHRLREGRRDRRHRRGADVAGRFRARSPCARRRKPPRSPAGPSRAREARSSPPTPTSRSPTASFRRLKPARPRSFNPADRCATRK